MMQQVMFQIAALQPKHLHSALIFGLCASLVPLQCWDSQGSDGLGSMARSAVKRADAS